ncbi:MAG: hypothetical protein K2Y18_03385 [Alphaproteobacteria bacterium]|jgi:hypothetical protein|nr:hypothetical protein [Alphaproteobacteria bacterium]
MSNVNQKTIKLMTTVGFVMAGLMSDTSAVGGKISCAKLAKKSERCATDLNFYNEFKMKCETQQPKHFKACETAHREHEINLEKCKIEMDKLKGILGEKIEHNQIPTPEALQAMMEPHVAKGCPQKDLRQLEAMIDASKHFEKMHTPTTSPTTSPATSPTTSPATSPKTSHWGVKPKAEGVPTLSLGGKRKKEKVAHEQAAAEPLHEVGAPPPPPPPPPPAPATLPGGALHIEKKPEAAQPALDPAAELENKKRAALLKRRGALAESGNSSMDESED